MATTEAEPRGKADALAALNHLNGIVTSFMECHAFCTAVELNLFDALENSPATPAELANKLAIHPDGCERLLIAIEHLQLVQRTGDLFLNSAIGDLLTSQSPTQLRSLMMWAKPFAHMWEFLPDALREFSPRWQQALGTTAAETFAAIYEDPIRLREFCGMMYAYNALGEEIGKRFDFGPYRCLLDVAGGPGTLSIPIGRLHPHLRGIIMDMAPICKVAEENIRANGLAGRFTTAVADLFAGPYPAGADAILLGWILHDWSDETCHKILHNCHQALPPGGALLINESVLNDDLSGSRFAVMLSLHMLVVTEPGSKERSAAQYRRLLDESGFDMREVIRFGGPRDLIVALRR